MHTAREPSAYVLCVWSERRVACACGPVAAVQCRLAGRGHCRCHSRRLGRHPCGARGCAAVTVLCHVTQVCLLCCVTSGQVCDHCWHLHQGRQANSGGHTAAEVCRRRVSAGGGHTRNWVHQILWGLLTVKQRRLNKGAAGSGVSNLCACAWRVSSCLGWLCVCMAVCGCLCVAVCGCVCVFLCVWGGWAGVWLHLWGGCAHRLPHCLTHL